MRVNKLIYAIGIGCTLCACSNQDEPMLQDDPNYVHTNQFVTIQIMTPSETKATFEDGDAAEYNVNGVGFYFYNRLGNCVATKYVTKAQFSTAGVPTNPAVTVMGTVEVELEANQVYDNVIAVLNPAANMLTNGKLNQLSKVEMLQKYGDYATQQKTSDNKGNFLMSNSVYVADETFNGSVATTNPYVAVPITSHNIYTKTGSETVVPVNIYVERTCAKVNVPVAPSFDAYEVDDSLHTNTIKVMTRSGEEKTITVIPEYQGMGLSVMPKNARLLKSLSGVTYKFDDQITNFVWNDTTNRRSYWETSLGESDDLAAAAGFNYTKWNDLTAVKSLTKYVNPNTDDATSILDTDNTTKLLVRAQLKYAVDNDTLNLDLVKFSGGYWMADYLLFHAATRARENLIGEDYGQFTDAQKKVIDTITAANLEKNIELVRETQQMDSAYLAKLAIKSGADLLKGMANGAEKTALKEVLHKVINKTLKEISDRQILYWKEGRTYFYVPIRHEGFTGLVGGANGYYLNGVVRNHWYKIEISKVWGLGTPVIDPENPINPERPKDAPKSYMTAKIHVLKWRMVNSEVVVH